MAEGTEQEPSDQTEETFGDIWAETGADGEAAKPADGEEEEPADGEPAKPADGEEAAKPADGEEAAKPADGEEAAKPADGEEEEPGDDLSKLSDNEYYQREIVANLPEAELELPNGETMQLSKFREEWPEMAAYADYMADLRVNNAITSAIESGEIADGSVLTKFLAKETAADLKKAVTAKHADSDAVLNSKEFKDWSKTQPPIVQKAIESKDPADNIWVLDQFKGGKAAVVADSVKETQTKKKNRVDKLHGASLSDKAGTKTTAKKTSGTDKEEFHDIWNETV